MTSKKRDVIVIDVRGTRRLGMGHVVRSLELARRLETLGNKVVFLRSGGVRATELIRRRRHRIVALSHVTAPSIVLVDRPDTDSALIDRHARRWPAAKIVALDYYGARNDRIAAMVNLNPRRESTRLPTSRRTLYRSGLEYAMLREPFRRGRSRRAGTRAQARRLLIAFGGTDATNWTSAAIRALGPHLKSAGIRADALVAKPPTIDRRARFADDTVRVHTFTADPVPMLLASDLALIGGGTMMMEVACLGVPAIVVPRNLAEYLFSRAFEQSGAVVVVRPSKTGLFPARNVVAAVTRLAANASRRSAMSSAGRALIDGRGTDRVIKLISTIASAREQ